MCQSLELERPGHRGVGWPRAVGRSSRNVMKDNQPSPESSPARRERLGRANTWRRWKRLSALAPGAARACANPLSWNDPVTEASAGRVRWAAARETS